METKQDKLNKTPKLHSYSAILIAMLTGLGFFLGFKTPIILWIHLVCACIFYGTLAYRPFKKIEDQSPRKNIHDSFILLLLQICFFTILFNAFVFLFSGITTSSVLQLFANISIYICIFSLNSFWKTHKIIKKLKLDSFFGIKSNYVMPILMAAAIFIILVNLFLIYHDITVSKSHNGASTCIWLFSYWIAILAAPIILTIQNTLDFLLQKKD